MPPPVPKVERLQLVVCSFEQTNTPLRAENYPWRQLNLSNSHSSFPSFLSRSSRIGYVVYAVQIVLPQSEMEKAFFQ